MGRALRLPGIPGSPSSQAVQNHTPDVIICDEIGRSTDVRAVATIKQRGVRLVCARVTAGVCVGAGRVDLSCKGTSEFG